MTMLARMIWGALALAGLAIVVAQHVGYLRRTRPLTFGAFLETGGWIVVTLVAIAAAGGGMAIAGTRTVELAAGAVGLLLIAIGGQFR